MSDGNIQDLLAGLQNRHNDFNTNNYIKVIREQSRF